ncbi:MAG: hypothetical protein ACRDRH_05585 [Pseudonocardia sp.]
MASDRPAPRRRHRRSPDWWPVPRRRRPGCRACLGLSIGAALCALVLALLVVRAVTA